LDEAHTGNIKPVSWDSNKAFSTQGLSLIPHPSRQLWQRRDRIGKECGVNPHVSTETSIFEAIRDEITAVMMNRYLETIGYN
jgi:hypothetical protein